MTIPTATPFGHRDLALSIAQTIADSVDGILDAVASVPLDVLDAREEAAALRDPEYVSLLASIADQRATRRSVAADDVFSRIRMRNQYRLDPWWREPLSTLCRKPAGRTLTRLRFAHQRLTRGWDDSDLWSLDYILSKRLGQQLAALADVTHGYPGTDMYPTPESWVADLRLHAAALTAYGDADRYLIGEREWKKRYADARRAYAWIGKVLPHLWD